MYDLAAYHTNAGALENPHLLAPDDVLATLATDGIERLYWLRLEAFGGRAVYVVKPGPFELERIYDAHSGERLDPPPVEILREIADDQLTGTQVADVWQGDEFNRYYTLDRVPAVAVTMKGDQPSELVFSRASGRVCARSCDERSRGLCLRASSTASVIRSVSARVCAVAGLGSPDPMRTPTSAARRDARSQACQALDLSPRR